VAADNDRSTSKRITAGSYDSFIVNCGKTECLIQKYGVLVGISQFHVFFQRQQPPFQRVALSAGVMSRLSITADDSVTRNQ